MTSRKRPSPAVQLARDVLHWNRCEVDGCDRCYLTEAESINRCHRRNRLRGPAEVTLARALLRATKERR